MSNVVDGRPSSGLIPASRFRMRYRALTDDEGELHDQIKDKAAELEALFGKVVAVPGHYNSLAIDALEESVMWIMKALIL